MIFSHLSCWIRIRNKDPNPDSGAAILKKAIPNIVNTETFVFLTFIWWEEPYFWIFYSVTKVGIVLFGNIVCSTWVQYLSPIHKVIAIKAIFLEEILWLSCYATDRQEKEE
jgi:hypothetical protein